MKIYHYDEKGVYLGADEAMLDPIEGKPMMPARATAEAPVIRDGLTPVFNDGWRYVENSVIAEKPESFDGKSFTFEEWEAYIKTDAYKNRVLHLAKEAKLKEINDKCDLILSGVTATYPQCEVLTFDQQLTEAKAYQEDKDAPTPLLSGLAKARGLELDDLVSRVLVKSQAYAIACGLIIGQRQAFEDRLDEAKIKEDVDNIVVEYEADYEN